MTRSQSITAALALIGTTRPGTPHSVMSAADALAPANASRKQRHSFRQAVYRAWRKAKGTPQPVDTQS